MKYDQNDMFALTMTTFSMGLLVCW